MSDQKQANAALSKKMGELSLHPFEFVMYSFPWGKPGTDLENMLQPEDWQIELLKSMGEELQSIVENFGKTDEEIDLADAVQQVVRKARASGHGIGKSALMAMITMWAISTCPNTRGVITANTETQLRTKTWPELGKWHRLCITHHWFEYTATSIYYKHKIKNKSYEKSWRIDAIPWSLNNTEAFAGLHNKGKRILLIMDEASAIPDKIWEVAEGAMTDKDTEIIFLAFGNPTRNHGRFYECFGRYKHRWDTQQIDSRQVTVSNKALIKEWISDYGEDSDFVRVRVKGQFPSQSDMQFLSTELVNNSMRKKIAHHQYDYAPVIIGVDCALYGDDEYVIKVRQGNWSKLLAFGKKINDDYQLAAIVRNYEKEYNADAVFIDYASGTGVVSAGRQMGRNWTLVAFGSKSPGADCYNMRAYMYSEFKKWLKAGGVLEDDPVFERQACAIEYTTKSDKLLLESKDSMRKRGLDSPDRPDALILTFAYKVTKHKTVESYNKYDRYNKFVDIHDDLLSPDEEYDPLA